MSTLIRPTFHALTLLCAACTCLFAAHTVSSVVDAWLQPLPSIQEEPPRKQHASKEELPTPLALAPLLPAPSAHPMDSKSTLEVRQLGPRSYEVSRGELEAVLANPNELLMKARVVPAFRNGVAHGFKLFALRPGSLYERLGLHNGDVLQRINGLSLDNPQRALEAFHTLRQSSRVELEVERSGQPLRLEYAIR